MKVRNWHKRNTGACIEQDATIYVTSSYSVPSSEWAQICINREDGSHMAVTLTPQEFLKFKAEVDWCASRWLVAAQHGVQPTADSVTITDATHSGG